MAASLFRRSENVSLNYNDDGDGLPVLYIHGVGSSLESWDGVIATMGSGYRHIRCDLRGHGQSSHTPGPYELTDFVEDAVALLNHLEIETVSLAGFSLGGLIAQAIALAHRDRLNALALISTVAGRTPEEQTLVRNRADTLARDGATVHLSVAVERWFTDEFRARHPEVLEARRKRSLENDPQCYAAAYQVLAGNDLAGQLHEIRLPTLIVTGENDTGSSPRMARLIHDRIDGSQLHILPNLKHAVLLEAPEEIAELLTRFFEAN